MIARAVNQANVKDERLAPKFLPQVSPGFEVLLDATPAPRSVAPRPARLERGVEQQPASRPETRKQYGHRADAEEPIPPEEPARKFPDRDPADAGAAGHLHHRSSEPTPPPESKQAEAADVPAKSLERNTELATRSGVVDLVLPRPGMMASAGAAAYAVADHSVGEEVHAELAGKLQAGEGFGKEETIVDEAKKLQNAVTFAGPEGDPVDEVGPKQPETPLDILNLSRKGSRHASQQEAALSLDTAIESAKERNEVLQRLTQPIQQPGTTAQAVSAAVAALGARNPQAETRPLDVAPAGTGVFKGATVNPGLPGLAQHATAAEAAPHLAKSPAETQAQQMLDRIADQAKWLIRNHRNEVTFRLQPEHLGEVRLKVVQKDGHLHVDMTVDSAAVKRLVESRMDDLHAQLQDQQLANGDFNFNVDVRQGDDSPRSDTFAMTAAAAAARMGERESAQGLPDAVLRPMGPVWGRSGSGVYA